MRPQAVLTLPHVLNGLYDKSKLVVLTEVCLLHEPLVLEGLS